MDTTDALSAVTFLILTLWQTNAFCITNNTIHLTQSQNLTCPAISPTNVTLDKPTQCCWMLYPTPRIKLQLLKLSLKDTILIEELHPATMDVVSIWQGNQTCSDGIIKCPFKLETVLFSHQTDILRSIQVQLDSTMQEPRVIHLDILSTQENSPCPHNCNCLQSDTQRAVVSCRYWDMDTVRDLPNTTVDLEMKTSSLVSIPENAFSHLYHLTYVNLGKNNLSFIDPGAFKGLQFVQKIHLHKNNILHFETEHCEGFPTTLSSLRLDGNKLLRLQPGVFKSCNHLVNLKLSRNNLTKLENGTFDGLSELISVTMEDNQIAHIELGALDGLVSLHNLDLSKNNLSTIGQHTFRKLSQLQVLTIQNNPWVTIEPFAFDGLSSIQIIFLNREERFWKGSKMALNSFHDLNNLQILNTDDHRICCLLPNPATTCNRETMPPLFDNCDERLLPTYAERLLLWIFSICALCGNTYVIVLRCREKNARNQTQSLLIMNLALSDLFMGCYMIMIAAADLYFGREFVLYAQDWQSSGVCKFAGLVSFLSSEASVLFVVLISLDRVLCVGLPHGKKRMTLQTARQASSLVWFVVVSLGVIAIVLQETTTTYGLANVCVGLPLVSNKVYDTVYKTEKSKIVGTAGEKVNLTTYELVDSGDNWQFSIAINLGLNFCAFLVVLGCYLAIGIIVAVKMPSKNLQSRKDHHRELKMAARMAVIVLTDFCCWMPVIIMGILVQSEAVDDTKIRNNYGWIVALVLPLNAALNPYLYTFATEMRNRKRQKANDIALLTKGPARTRATNL
ncbi:uncharacterized protein [Amphiura filiformis]|uniref:uncharacterized protein n=1 Tax=Amphiura filiformis TaxID=82378 RepID=UPI003B210AE7